MNAKVRDKQVAYLAAMGRTVEPERATPTSVAIRPAGTSETDEVTVTYDAPRRTWRVRGKTTRAIIAEVCRELKRAPAQLIATPTKQGDFHSAWIKANDGPDAQAEGGGHRLAFVTGLTPTVINIVLGHRIPRVEPVPGEQRNFVRFVPIGSDQAKAARAEARKAAGVADQAVDAAPDEASEAEADELPTAETFPEPELSGDHE